MKLRALLWVAAFTSVGRADVSTPAAPRAGEILPRTCALGEWLAIKHAVARHCANRKDDDCVWARENLKMQFCDGEQPDPERCANSLMVREAEERCTIEARAPDGTYHVRVWPDCWSWILDVAPGKRKWRVERFTISASGCD